MERIYCNDNWKFSKTYIEGMEQAAFDESGMETVRLPHSNVELPYHYFDEGMYQMVSGYRYHFKPEEEWREKKLWLTFEGVAHRAEVYVNGTKAAEHNCGYTAFSVDISPYIRWGVDNLITVKADSRESLNIPPFGRVIDYMTYGGIYREAYLDIKNPVFIEDVFVRTPGRTENGAEGAPDKKRLEWDMTLWVGKDFISEEGKVSRKNLSVQARLLEKATQRIIKEFDRVCVSEKTTTFQESIEGVKSWDMDNPNLYLLKIDLYEEEAIVDSRETTFGFRQCEFREDGFYLNNRKIKIRGLNRHQSYPYVGYAMPKTPQQTDADILKWELGLNAVRTSHYPQSQYFLDRCDEIGLLVFTEIPGWQHIGDEAWKEQAVANTREMVLQYRNHPSIIIWGVRINESQDDDAFYRKTNQAAHELDSTRQTGGVRFIKKSSLLEDVYTYNDFLHDGKTPGVSPKKSVTPDRKKGYLVTEYNGHMFPTKAFDCEEHRLEQAVRHCRVINDLYKEEDIAGGLGWCMFDYNTHKDFGSGDRICYHGVMDMFRNPKLAAAVYGSQSDERLVCEVSSSMDIGEHPRGCIGDIYVFTNADSIKLYKNKEFIKEFYPSKKFPHMPHPPIIIDDLVGGLIEKCEPYDHKTSEEIKMVLTAIAKYGFELPAPVLLKIAKLMLVKHFTLEKGTELYNKYIGNWGGDAITYTIEAIKDKKVFKTIEKMPPKKVWIKAAADTQALKEEGSYDVATIRIQAVDENNNLLPYYQEPVVFETEGAVELIGPKMVSLKGGMGGTYVKTTGEAGKGMLRIKGARTEPVVIEFEAKRKE